MPAPRTDIDRDGIAASIALRGYRETARATGVPIGTVHRIGKLAGVVAPDPNMRPAVPITAVKHVGTLEHVGTAARPAHAVVTDELQRLGSSARLSTALYAERTLTYAAEQARTEPETALARAGDVKSVVGSAQGANVPGFEREREQSANNTVVNIALLGVDPASCAIDITSTALPGTAQE